MNLLALNKKRVRIISFILIITFISLDIAYAYPPEHNPGNSTLSTPSIMQQPIDEHAARFREAVFSQGALLASVYDIGEYFFGRPEKDMEALPSKYAEEVIKAGLGKVLGESGIEILNIVPVEYLKKTVPEKLKTALKEIGFNGTLPDEGVVLVLYRKDGKKFLVQIAKKESVSQENLPGYDLDVSDKYLVKYVPEDYTGEARVSQAAQAPKSNDGVRVEDQPLIGSATAEAREGPKAIAANNTIKKLATALGIGIVALSRAWHRLKDQLKIRSRERKGFVGDILEAIYKGSSISNLELLDRAKGDRNALFALAKRLRIVADETNNVTLRARAYLLMGHIYSQYKYFGIAARISKRYIDLALGAMIEATKRSVELPAHRLKIPAEYSDCDIVIDCPVRVDLSHGGASDLFAMTYEKGGRAVNIAVDLNGKPPIKIKLRRLRAPVIRLISRDLDVEKTIESKEEMLDYFDKSDALRLFKAAFVTTGIVQANDRRSLREILEGMGGGIELEVESDVPKGSGLGTSSILGVGLVEGLYKISGQKKSKDEVVDAGLYLEQTLGVGGGWQDSVGGMFGGIKVITSQPGKPQPRARVINVSPDFIKKLEDRIVLYYTGKSHFAGDILTKLTIDFISRSRVELESRGRLAAMDEAIIKAIENEDIDKLGSLISEFWREWKILSPEASNEEVEKLFGSVKDLVAGSKLCGAGGGGFALFITKKGKKGEVEKRLKELYGNAENNIYNGTVNKSGVSMSVYASHDTRLLDSYLNHAAYDKILLDATDSAIVRNGGIPASLVEKLALAVNSGITLALTGNMASALKNRLKEKLGADNQSIELVSVYGSVLSAREISDFADKSLVAAIIDGSSSKSKYRARGYRCFSVTESGTANAHAVSMPLVEGLQIKGADATEWLLEHMITNPALDKLRAKISSIKEGQLVIFSGFSGTGKGTIFELLSAIYGDKMAKVLLYTTRDIRKGEKQGREYHFVSSSDFDAISSEKPMISASIHGPNKRYGVLIEDIEAAMKQGKIVFLEVGYEMAHILIDRYQKSASVFMTPTDGAIEDIKTELRFRLKVRASENEDGIASRLLTADKEDSARRKYRDSMTNDRWSLSKAAGSFVALVNKNAAILTEQSKGPASAQPRKTPSAKGTVLVTGGAGYIGSHTVRRLLKDGYDVVVLDNLVKGRQFSIERNKDFADKAGRKIVFEKGDLGDRDFVKGAFSRNNITAVMHFAAFIEVGESGMRPAAYFKNNIINTLYLLEAMKDAGVGRIVFSSSAAVYGNPKEVPIPEGSETSPVNPYGYTKLAMEKMIKYYQEKFGIKWVAFRYFNASGASSDGDLGESHFPESHLIPLTIDKLSRGEKMKAFGTDYKTRDGTCLRDYVSVDDLASAHVLALGAEDEALNRAYNLGSGSGLTVKEVIENVGRLMGVTAEWLDAGRRSGDPASLTAVSTAFQSATGWRSLASSIDIIISSAITWFRNRPEEAKEPKPLPDMDEDALAEEIAQALSHNQVLPEELKSEILTTLRLNMRYAAVSAKLKEAGQEHLLAGWDDLSLEEKDRLLKDIEGVNWKDMAKLYDGLIDEKGNPGKPVFNVKGFKPAPVIANRNARAASAGQEVLEWGAREKEGKTRFATIVVAGGTGSGLKYKHAKGLFPATPLSNKALYTALVNKLQAAARAYGHNKMYPLIFMVSDQTDVETMDFIMKSEEWKDIKDRVIFVYQKVLPGLTRKADKKSGGKAFLRARDRLNLGGAGHGDAFDYVLNPGERVKGLVWSDERGAFIEVETVKWLKGIGVEYVQYTNVDNLLNPLADKYLIGEHVLSRNAEKERQGRAHISLALIKKTQWDQKSSTYADRLGNVIEVDGEQESIDYTDATKEVNACPYGDPSIKVVTIDSLALSKPIGYSAAPKTDKDAAGQVVDIFKFERSSGNKLRYGALLGYDGDDVFAGIKKPSDEAKVDTPATAKDLQSKHWRRLVVEALPGARIPASTVIELPWDADYMSPEALAEKLRAINFEAYLRENVGLLVAPDFSRVMTVLIKVTASADVEIVQTVDLKAFAEALERASRDVSEKLGADIVLTIGGSTELFVLSGLPVPIDKIGDIDLEVNVFGKVEDPALLKVIRDSVNGNLKGTGMAFGELRAGKSYAKATFSVKAQTGARDYETDFIIKRLDGPQAPERRKAAHIKFLLTRFREAGSIVWIREHAADGRLITRIIDPVKEARKFILRYLRYELFFGDEAIFLRTVRGFITAPESGYAAMAKDIVASGRMEILTTAVRAIEPKPKPMIVAHRGGFFDGVKPNSLNAIRRSISLGVDAVEFDMQMTRDGQLVAIHDEKLSGKKIGEMTLLEVRRIDSDIPTIGEINNEISGKARLHIHIVWTEGKNEKLISTLSDFIKNNGIVDRSLIISFYPDDLTSMKKHLPKAKRCLVFQPDDLERVLASNNRLQPLIEAAAKAGAQYVTWPRLVPIDKNIVASLRKSGLAVDIGTGALSPADALKMMSSGVDIVTIDNPQAIIFLIDAAQTMIDYIAQRDILPEKADLVIAFGNEYLETVFTVADLCARGVTDKVMFSGGIGHSTANLVDVAYPYLGVDRASIANLPEAEIMKRVFEKEMARRGMAPGSVTVYLEKESKNCQQNIEKSRDMIIKENIPHDDLILVQQPPIQRRQGLTFEKHFPKGLIFKNVYNYAAFIPSRETLNDAKYMTLIVDETEKLEIYSKPQFGFTTPLKSGSLPDSVRAALNVVKKALYPDQDIEVAGNIVASHLKAGEKSRTDINKPIQVETGSGRKGSSFTGFSSTRYQGVFSLKSGSATIRMGSQNIDIGPGDIITLFGPSGIYITGDSEYIIARQTDALTTLPDLQEKIKGEAVEPDGIFIKKDNDVLAQVFRSASGDLLASFHRSGMAIPSVFSMITPQSAAIGIGLKIGDGAEASHRHDRDGLGRMEASLCLGGSVKAHVADRDGNGAEAIDVKENEVVVLYPDRVHGFELSNAKVAIIMQDPARGAVKTDKIKVTIKAPGPVAQSTEPKIQPSKTTQLFEIVESAAIGKRAEFVDAGNKLIDSLTAKTGTGVANKDALDKNMATAEIRQRVERAIAAVDSLKKEDVAPETRTAIESLKKNLNQLEADGAFASLIALARQAKREGQKLIIGLETDWIPGIADKNSLQTNAITALMKEIDSIGEVLRSMDLDNVEVIRGSSDQLAGAILNEAGKTHTRMHNIVVMASASTINSGNFEAFRNAEEGDRPFLAGIDPAELVKLYAEFGESLTKQLHIRLAGLLYLTLELAAGKEPPQTPMIVSYDRKQRIVIFLPRAEPMDYELLKSNYMAQKAALEAA